MFDLVRIDVDERIIIQRLAGKLKELGYYVYTNIFVKGLELDIMAVEKGSSARPLVYVYEIKTRSKPKFIEQITKRMEVADYVYAVTPYTLYPWIVKKLDHRIGLIVYMNNELHILRNAKFLGNGVNALSSISTM